jgi:hypothetical protein
MARELKTVDVTHVPELLRLAREVRASREPRVLRGDGEDLAILTPTGSAWRRTRRRELAEDDPLWTLVGSATDAAPTDASKKHEYLGEAPRPAQS